MPENIKPDSWPMLFKTFHRLLNFMEDHIKEAGFPNIETYDVLWTLEQAPDHALRLHELGERVYIARCNITRLCDKLEKEGLVKKMKCDQDKRGIFAHLTPEGQKLRRKMWVVYKKLIDENFSDKLTGEEHKQIIKIMTKVRLSTE